MLPFEKTHLFKCPVKSTTAFLLVASFSPIWCVNMFQERFGKVRHYSWIDQNIGELSKKNEEKLKKTCKFQDYFLNLQSVLT